ncbi:MAG: RIP metalloprotease RseP, partial [Muribaculaceae bacterium]|nr:RIP metalloprotease RseP [Muribaculaceae bacterium]
ADKTMSNWRKTIYGIGWLPLGGYVKIAGMIDESMDREQMAQPAKADEFRVKPAWKRLLVMIGGVMNNFILAIIIYAGIAWYWGEQYIPIQNAYEGYDFTEQAQQMGFRNGDIIIASDGKPLADNDMMALYHILDGKTVTVARGVGHSDTVVINLPPNAVTRVDESGFMALRVPVVVKRVMPGEPAAESGLQPNDRLIAVNGEPTPSFGELSPALMRSAGKQSVVTVLRGNDTISLTAVPNGAGKLGFELKKPTEIFDIKVNRYTLLQAIPVGISNGTNFLITYVGSLKHVFTKEGAKSVGGFGAIGSMFPERWNWRTFWELSAFLAIILAFMNIIPIPALDGGHVAFLMWEMITGRAPSEKFLEYAQMAGMFLLFALLIYANFNDLYRFVLK